MIKELEDLSIEDIQKKMLSDYLFFTRILYESKTGRNFNLSKPISNESHFITVSKKLTEVFNGKIKRLYIGLPPGWGKSELCKHFVAWCFAHYPDCKFLYISHSHDLASMHTYSIRQTMMMPIFQKLFKINIKKDSSAKDYFLTNDNGAVAAFGSGGGITGHDAGLPIVDRFSGAIIIDDVHKPNDVHSDTIRDKVKINYFETIERRLRSPNVPIIMIGQRLHEDDLPGYLLNGGDGNEWDSLIIKAIDDSGNARYPEVDPLYKLKIIEENQPYVFSSQYQQDPIPAGGALFKKDLFPILEEDPNIIATFITCDSAETDKDYNDATVFSFWGLYKISFNGKEIDDVYGIHWIDCREIRVEPCDLESEFLDFYSNCMQYKIKPKFSAIEKKSTGVTLLSVLKKIPGISLIDIKRNGSINNKSDRFISMQQYINQKRITFTKNKIHVSNCINHMSKITANNTHKHDDICDTCYDAIKIALIDNTLINITKPKLPVAQNSSLYANQNRLNNLRRRAYNSF